MKRVLLIAAFSIAMITTSMASIIPTESLMIIKTAEVEVTLVDIVQKDLFQVAQYSPESNSLDFVTADEIRYIQIFSEKGELKFQLPVLSKKVRISKGLFNSGEYRLGFIMDGHKTIEFTGVKVK